MSIPAQPSWRKPVGMLLILVLIVVWAIMAVTLIGLLGPIPVYVQPLVYIVTGIVWIWLLPMRRLLGWMETGRWRTG